MSWLHRDVVFFTQIAFLGGCASQSTLPYTTTSGGDRVIPREIVVTAAHFQPDAKPDLVLRSKAELAGAGAAGGALAGVENLAGGAGHCGGPLCAPAFLLLLPVFMGVGAVVGAVRDGPSAASAETIKSGKEAMQEGIAKLDLQRNVQGAIVKELRDHGVAANVTEEWAVGPATPEESLKYEAVSSQARDAILESSILGFQFKKVPRYDKKKQLTYRLSMKTRVRLLAPISRDILDEMSYVHESAGHTATEWLGNDAEIFKVALEEAIRHTSASVVHEMFLIYYPRIMAAPASTGKNLVPEYVLRPVYPDAVLSFDLRYVFKVKYLPSRVGLQFVPVKDLQPTLEWEEFPRSVDVADIGGEAERFSDVRYEVAVYPSVWNVPMNESLYRRTGLREPSHRLERPLTPCARYFWTVRAHFTLDGWPRVTDWMGAYDAFPSIKPWEFRRGLKSERLLELAPDPEDRFIPFRAPAANGETCD